MTEKYHENDPLIDLISDDYRMLQMISRFGITLGFGDKTVAEACRGAGVDVPTFLTVVNYLKDSAHAHVRDMAEVIDLNALMKYLRNSHTYYVDYRLPQIRRSLISAIDCSGRNQIALLILKFYDEYAQEVKDHMEYENTHVHPHVDLLLKGRLPKEGFQIVVNHHTGNHASIEKSIAELKNIIIKYYPNDANAALLSDVLMDIYMVEEDLLTHCLLEDTLFAACVHRLEEEVRERGGQPEIEDPTPPAPPTDDLSDREKEVIRLIAEGLANKEIADRMCIAVNTVMTHRRNIYRKIGIHAAAGLTIYAIVNGLINVDDVKL